MTELNVHPVIYTKEHCPACTMTQRLFKQNNISYVDNYYGNMQETNELDLSSSDKAKREWSDKKIQKLKDKYMISSLPFIKVVDDEGGVKDFWSGFRPDKIKEWFPKQ